MVKKSITKSIESANTHVNGAEKWLFFIFFLFVSPSLSLKNVAVFMESNMYFLLNENICKYHHDIYRVYVLCINDAPIPRLIVTFLTPIPLFSYFWIFCFYSLCVCVCHCFSLQSLSSWLPSSLAIKTFSSFDVLCGSVHLKIRFDWAAHHSLSLSLLHSISNVFFILCDTLRAVKYWFTYHMDR